MKNTRRFLCLVLTLVMIAALAVAPVAEAKKPAVPDHYTFPLEEKVEINGLTNFPAGSESEPNNRTIFKRLEEATNVHVKWRAIQSDQWGDKIALEMSNVKTLPEFVFNAQFGDVELLKYAKQGAIIHVEEYIDQYMPNLSKVFEQAPEYKTMCTDENGHIWALPWIEQLGSEKTAIQTIGNMPFINLDWLGHVGGPLLGEGVGVHEALGIQVMQPFHAPAEALGGGGADDLAVLAHHDVAAGIGIAVAFAEAVAEDGAVLVAAADDAGERNDVAVDIELGLELVGIVAEGDQDLLELIGGGGHLEAEAVKTYTATFTLSGDNGVGEFFFLKSENIDDRYTFDSVSGTHTVTFTAEDAPLFFGIQCGNLGAGNSVTVSDISVVAVEDNEPAPAQEPAEEAAPAEEPAEAQEPAEETEAEPAEEAVPAEEPAEETEAEPAEEPAEEAIPVEETKAAVEEPAVAEEPAPETAPAEGEAA